MTFTFADISHHQTGVDLAAHKAAGCNAAEIKDPGGPEAARLERKVMAVALLRRRPADGAVLVARARRAVESRYGGGR